MQALFQPAPHVLLHVKNLLGGRVLSPNPQGEANWPPHLAPPSTGLLKRAQCCNMQCEKEVRVSSLCSEVRNIAVWLLKLVLPSRGVLKLSFSCHCHWDEICFKSVQNSTQVESPAIKGKSKIVFLGGENVIAV